MNINRVLKDITDECKSRSGLVNLDPTGGDGSTFSLIWLTCLNKTCQQKEVTDIQTFKEEFINNFMTLHHDIVSKYSRFNWNY